jgi:hypothetical protein
MFATANEGWRFHAREDIASCRRLELEARGMDIVRHVRQTLGHASAGRVVGAGMFTLLGALDSEQGMPTRGEGCRGDDRLRIDKQ